MWRTECFQNLTEDFQHEATMVSTLFGWPIRKIRSVIPTARLSKLCGFWKKKLVWVCARLYLVFVVFYTWIKMQSTTWLSEDRHSHRLPAKISLACRDRSHTPPISSFSVFFYIFVLTLCVQCILCSVHAYVLMCIPGICKCICFRGFDLQNAFLGLTRR